MWPPTEQKSEAFLPAETQEMVAPISGEWAKPPERPVKEICKGVTIYTAGSAALSSFPAL